MQLLFKSFIVTFRDYTASFEFFLSGIEDKLSISNKEKKSTENKGKATQFQSR